MLAPVAEADPSEPGLLELGIASARAYPEFIADLRAATPLDPGYLRVRHPARRPRRRRGRGARARPRAARAARPGARRGCGRARPGPRAGARSGAAARRRASGRSRRRSARALVAALADALAAPAGSCAREPRSRRCSPGPAASRRAAGRRRGDRLRAGGDRRGGVVGRDRRHRPAARASRACRCDRSRARSSGCAIPAGAGLVQRVLRSERMYLVPRGDGRYVLGATMEERGFDRTVTAGAVFELLRELAELVPGSERARRRGALCRIATRGARQRAGARPGLAGGTAVGDRPLSWRRAARADHRPADRRPARRGRARPGARRASPRTRFTGVPA